MQINQQKFDIICRLKTLVHKKSGFYFFGATLIAMFVFSFFFFAPAGKVYALDCPDGSVENVTLNQCENASGDIVESATDQTEEVACGQNGGTWSGGVCQVAETGGSETGGTVGSGGSPFSCGPVSFFMSFGLCTIWLVGKVLFTILAWVVMLSAMLLQFSIDFNMNIKQFLDGSSGIDLVWSTIRDLANILFIFFLLWISIQTILGMGDGIKKALPHILLAALLINFSMFTTRVIIDASNIVSLQFYSSMTQNDHSIDESLLRNMRLQGFFNRADTADSAVSGDTSLLGQASTKTNLLIIVVLGSIFLVIAAFAFLNAAFLFIARVVVLTLLVATSPIAFIASILPQRLQKYHKMWWDNLWDQMLVAPVFLLMLWVILKISGSMSAAQMGADGRPAGAFLDALNPGNLGTADTTAPLFNFLILIGLLIAAVKVTKELSGSMGASITSMGGAALGMAAGGVGGFALRNTVGRAASKLAQSETLRNWDSQNKFFVGKALLKGTEGLSKASMDVRGGVPLVGGVAGKIAGEAGVSVGFGKAGGEGGHQARLDKQVKERQEYIQSRQPNRQEIAKQDQIIARERSGLAAHVTGGGAETDATGIAIKTRIRIAEDAKKTVLTQRKEQAATETESRKADTLWSKIARKDKLGAAKYRIEEHKKSIEGLEKKLTEAKSDIKSLGRISAPTPAQLATLTQAQKDKTQAEADIAQEKFEISQLEADRT